MRNTIGTVFCVTTFGESHGAGVGAVIDGCPANLPLQADLIQMQLDRRRPGQSSVTTQREEADRVEILSGVEKGITLGSPIALLVRNQDMRPGDYARLRDIPRPSHADFTYRTKYGVSAGSGGGRSSARETVGRVAAGAVAQHLLQVRHSIEVVAWVSMIGGVTAAPPDPLLVTRAAVDANPVRCPDAEAARRMQELVESAGAEGDSVGGIVTCVCRGVPVGWGEPVFGKANARLAGAMMSIPAAKGFDVGSGFAAAAMRGSAHNDPFILKGGHLGTATNRSGGIQGGITNGEPMVFRVAFKPTATIRKEQQTVDFNGNPVVLGVQGRHDPCVLPRAVPVVEAMAALVLADLMLLGETAG